mmetsp:Transcript_39605/g.35371  ORF Transcript_39605/g.35371 Transcript_39605/m.35371 type:complete len:105 (-) Transcript_39605:500-814(-)
MEQLEIGFKKIDAMNAKAFKVLGETIQRYSRLSTLKMDMTLCSQMRNVCVRCIGEFLAQIRTLKVLYLNFSYNPKITPDSLVLLFSKLADKQGEPLEEFACCSS